MGDYQPQLKNHVELLIQTERDLTKDKSDDKRKWFPIELFNESELQIGNVIALVYKGKSRTIVDATEEEKAIYQKRWDNTRKDIFSGIDVNTLFDKDE